MAGAAKFGRIAAALVCVGQLACVAPPKDLASLDTELLTVLAKRFAPVTRLSGMPPSPPCPERQILDGRPDPICRDADVSAELYELALTLRKLDLEADEPALLRVQALWALANGVHDRAVDLLATALDREPTAARHNDLAAALLLRAAASDRPEDLAVALDHAVQASVLDLRLVEARVNRAFALDSLGLRHAAERAWAATEPSATADAYRSVLTAQARSSKGSERSQGEVLLGSWAASLVAGDSVGADAALAASRPLAVDVASHGDTTLLESIAAIDKADPECLRRLEAGHSAFHRVRGDATYSTCDQDALRAAKSALASAETPFVAWVSIDRAICDYFDGDYPSATHRLDSVLARWGTPSRPAIGGRANALLGLITMLQGRYAEAEAHYSEAVAHYESIGEEG